MNQKWDCGLSFLPYGRHAISEEDIAAVTAVLKSDFLTSGPAVADFEAKLREVTGAAHVVACSNGTTGLHLAVASLNLPPNSIGVVPAITFAASANCLLYCGHQPMFVDVDPKTGLMDMGQLENLLAAQEKKAVPVKVVVTVAFAGQPSDLAILERLKSRFGFRLIEDSCHALGAFWGSDRIPVGGSSISDFSVLSFHPVKHIATGEGGAVATQNDAFGERARLLRTHGITKDPQQFSNQKEAFASAGAKENIWYYEMQQLGFNYRLPDILAALGSSQLNRLNEFVARRRQIATVYDEHFARSEIATPLSQNIFGECSYHLYVALLKNKHLIDHKSSFMRALSSKGVGTQVHYIPVPMLPYYAERKYEVPPNALNYYRSALSLPIFPSMSDRDAKTVCRIFDETAAEFVKGNPEDEK